MDQVYHQPLLGWGHHIVRGSEKEANFDWSDSDDLSTENIQNYGTPSTPITSQETSLSEFLALKRFP